MPRVLAAVAALILALPVASRAVDEDDPEPPGQKLSAVQQRRFRMDHELSFGVGGLPADAFYKGLYGSVSYDLHLTEAWAWQVVSAGYSLNFDTSLRQELINNFGKDPGQFAEVVALATTGLNWAPLYGKVALFNKRVVHAEVFLTAGGGVAWMALARTNALVPEGYGGAGLRVFLSPGTSVRFDARYMLNVRNPTVTYPVPVVIHRSTVTLTLALAVNLGTND
jgi:outer membrane beta-barrel protein